ncbi:MAG: leucyl aminopeptidase, partial [Gammaproteobacteria bacterium]|nr:leucyl aminopeptidase [Gammaproteobacteria bacterium]
MKQQGEITMEYKAKSEQVESLQSACVLVGVYQKRKLTPTASLLDDRLQGLLESLLKRDDIEGKVGDLLIVNHTGDQAIERVILVGLGKSGELTPKAYRSALNAAARALKATHAKHALSALHEAEVEGQTLSHNIRQFIEIVDSSLYRFTELKTESLAPAPKINKMDFLVHGAKSIATAEKAIEQAEATSMGV